ncbi:MAG: tetratricopeptide repeat protein [Candidatus Electrothrix sp. YB6]
MMNMLHNLTGNLLDTFTKAALAALVVITTVMLVQHRTAAHYEENAGTDRKEQLEKKYQQRLERDEKIYREVETLLGQKRYRAAADKLQEVQEAYPDNPRSLIYQAQLQYNTGKMMKAIASYREAVDKEPDFVDQNTPLFNVVGKFIVADVKESKEKVLREMKLRPNDKEVKKAFDEILYLQRRVAGGCE